MAAVTAAGEFLRDEIRRGGPVTFRRFMEVALYHPEFGYYRRARDPFGRAGDYYTAEQVQPVFGILIAELIRGLRRQMDGPEEFTVVELGAGRREMAPAFDEWRYVPVDVEGGEVPAGIRGVVFSNEFFDALPVEAVRDVEGIARLLRVGFSNERFDWVVGEPAEERIAGYIRRWLAPDPPGRTWEVSPGALAWMEKIAAALEDGFVVTIDYGYTRAESVRFPAGTLMSYRRHRALENVLENPGEQDITAHVPFTALEEHGSALGLSKVRFESLSQTLLAAGEADQFGAALAGADAADAQKRRLQLKTLLFGMGETFRTLVQRKAPK